MPNDTTIIEQCAAVVDHVADELEAALKPQTPKSAKPDRTTVTRFRFAIRWAKKTAARIRALDPKGSSHTASLVDTDKLEKAVVMLKELRPVIETTRPSNWKREILGKIDDLIS